MVYSRFFEVESAASPVRCGVKQLISDCYSAVAVAPLGECTCDTTWRLGSGLPFAKELETRGCFRGRRVSPSYDIFRRALCASCRGQGRIVQGGLKTLDLPSSDRIDAPQDAGFGALRMVLQVYNIHTVLIPEEFTSRDLRSCGVVISVFAVDFQHAQHYAQGGNHRGLPPQDGVSVGADPRVCPHSHVEIISRRHLLTAPP